MNGTELLAQIVEPGWPTLDNSVAMPVFDVLADCVETRGHTVTRVDELERLATRFKHGVGPSEAVLVVEDQDVLHTPSYLGRIVARWLEAVHAYEGR